MYDYCDLEPDGDTAIFGLHAIISVKDVKHLLVAAS